jgi:biopolymer transport protein ExbD
VRLPIAAFSSEKPETQDQTVVAIDSQGRYFVNGVPVREEELRQRVDDILAEKTERIVLIKADDEAQYGAVMAAMDQLRLVGIEDIGLITDPKPQAGGN